MSNVIKATFDTNTVEGMKKLFNAKTGASTSLKNVESGFQMQVTDVLIYEDEVNNGYANDGVSTITVLFTDDGESYASISPTIAEAGKSLVDFLDVAGDGGVAVKLVKANSSKGQEFLNLQIVM